MEELMEALFDCLSDYVPLTENRIAIYKHLIPVLLEIDADLVDVLTEGHPIFHEAYLEYCDDEEIDEHHEDE